MKNCINAIRSTLLEDLLIFSFFLASSSIIFLSIDSTTNINNMMTLANYVAEYTQPITDKTFA